MDMQCVNLADVHTQEGTILAPAISSMMKHSLIFIALWGGISSEAFAGVDSMAQAAGPERVP